MNESNFMLAIFLGFLSLSNQFENKIEQRLENKNYQLTNFFYQ